MRHERAENDRREWARARAMAADAPKWAKRSEPTKGLERTARREE
jgi:hypothetical protein